MGWRARIPVFAAALWWGSLSVVGFVVVPLLFQHLESPSQAGRMAARLFEAQTWVSLACGVLLLIAARTEEDPPSIDWAGGALLFISAGMLLAILQQFGVAPRIVARQDLRFWHTAGSAMYVGQWACALAVLWKLAGRSAGSLSRKAGEGEG